MVSNYLPAQRPRACVRLASVQRSGASQSGSHGAALRTRTVKEALVASGGGYSCPRPTSLVREGRARCRHDAVSVCLCRLSLAFANVRPAHAVWPVCGRKSPSAAHGESPSCVFVSWRHAEVPGRATQSSGANRGVQLATHGEYTCSSARASVPSSLRVEGREGRTVGSGCMSPWSGENGYAYSRLYLVHGSGAFSLYSVGTDGRMSGECACQENSGSVQTQGRVWHWQAKIVTVGQSLTMNTARLTVLRGTYR